MKKVITILTIITIITTLMIFSYQHFVYADLVVNDEIFRRNRENQNIEDEDVFENEDRNQDSDDEYSYYNNTTNSTTITPSDSFNKEEKRLITKILINGSLILFFTIAIIVGIVFAIRKPKNNE